SERLRSIQGGSSSSLGASPFYQRGSSLSLGASPFYQRRLVVEPRSLSVLSKRLIVEPRSLSVLLKERPPRPVKLPTPLVFTDRLDGTLRIEPPCTTCAGCNVARSPPVEAPAPQRSLSSS